jgi:hypothetical protein
MELNNRQREYLAGSISKVGEYLVSLVILGQLVAGKANLALTVTADVLFSVSLALGTFISRKVENEKMG